MLEPTTRVPNRKEPQDELLVVRSIDLVWRQDFNARLEWRPATKCDDKVVKRRVQQPDSTIAYLLGRQDVPPCVQSLKHVVFEAIIAAFSNHFHAHERAL